MAVYGRLQHLSKSWSGPLWNGPYKHQKWSGPDQHPGGNRRLWRMGLKKREKIDAWTRQFHACADTPPWNRLTIYICMWGGVADIINCAKFRDNPSKGFGAVRPPKRRFPLKTFIALTTVSALLCRTVMGRISRKQHTQTRLQWRTHRIWRMTNQMVTWLKVKMATWRRFALCECFLFTVFVNIRPLARCSPNAQGLPHWPHESVIVVRTAMTGVLAEVALYDCLASRVVLLFSIVSVCDLWLEFLENNLRLISLTFSLSADPNMTDLLQRKHPKF